MNKKGRPKDYKTQWAKAAGFNVGSDRTIRRIGTALLGVSVASDVYQEQVGKKLTNVSDLGAFYGKHGEINRGYFELLGKISERVSEGYARSLHIEMMKAISREQNPKNKDVLSLMKFVVNSEVSKKVV